MTRFKLNYFGLIFGLVGYLIALSPSLMPRPELYMGIVAGVGFSLWYSFGILVSHLIRQQRRFTEPSFITKRRAWLSLLISLPFFIALTTILTRYWHNDQLTLLGLEPLSSLSGIKIFALATITFVILLLIQRAIRGAYRYLRSQVARLTFLPKQAITVLAVALATLLIVTALTGVLQRTAVVAINDSFSFSNNSIDPNLSQPISTLRSGGPQSLAAWQDLGRQGRRFVSNGPDATAISHFSGQAAKEPIRVYTGINNAPDPHDRVDLALRELERTGAFDRQVLMVALPTGSGWIESETVAAFEYMHNGDTAIVTSQYSFLPSGLSIFLDRGQAVAMGKELLHAVEAKLRTLPESNRPKLVLYGLSLGSFGSQADFTGQADLNSRLDGALFVGTPGFSQPWRSLVQQRDPGSPQVDPIYNQAQVIKFASNSDQVLHDINPKYKILFFQYPTDPFSWFDASLLYKKPDWLKEQPGRGVSSHLRWVPIVTFTQIAVDQLFSYIDSHHGHDYHDNTVAPMAAVTKPNNWTPAKSQALQELIAPTITVKDQ